MLYACGGVAFEVAPVNIHVFEREVGADFAAKDIVGERRPREFTGEADEKVSFSGRLFPQRFGGLEGLGALQAMARAGQPQILIRGDGLNLGWYLIESVKDRHAYIDREGVGRMIEFDIELVATPRRAGAGAMARMLMNLFQ